MAADQQQSGPEPISFKDFLEKAPPSETPTQIQDLATTTWSHNTPGGHVTGPQIQLHCKADACNGVRFFESDSTRTIPFKQWMDLFLQYKCRNCEETVKTYALSVYCHPSSDMTHSGYAHKYGEYPAFGPPTPSRVIKLLGREGEYYLKGRRAENQGMGIGAFGYYRRVVENQKNRLLDEIIRVAKQIGAPQEMLDDLDAAKSETQFSKAVDAIKHGLPSALLVDGHNPLTLLHTALSKGIHAKTDEECLEVAASIRVVLADLADRLGHAMKERSDLTAALSRLMK
jgi:hypothetical protein